MSSVVDTRGSQTALDLKCIKILRLFLSTIAAWPEEVFVEKPWFFTGYYRKLLPFLASIVCCGEFYFLKNNISSMDFLLLGHCFIDATLTVLCITRMCLPSLQNYGVVTHDFLCSFHLINFKHKNERFENMYWFIEKISYYFTITLCLSMCGGLILYNVQPLVQLYQITIGDMTVESGRQNSTLKFSIYYSYPGFDPATTYYPTTAVNLYLTYNCSIALGFVDLLLSLMVFQIIGHVLILRENLGNLPQPKYTASNDLEPAIIRTSIMYTAEENRSVHGVLAECASHHSTIIKFIKNMSDFFGPVLSVSYGFHLCTCCVLLLECSQGEVKTILQFGPLTIIIFGELIHLSVTFEIVHTVSYKLKDSVYAVPWECMDARNRRAVAILLSRVQRPMQVTTFGIIPVGVTTMAQILKTTFTYFAFLRSTQQ